MALNNTALVMMPHPLLSLRDREIYTTPFSAGETIAEYLQRNVIDVGFPCVLTLDGVLLPRERWDVVCPRQHQIIEIRAVSQGGDGSDMKRAILTVLVLIAAAYGQTWAASYFGSAMAGTVAYAGIVYAGMSLINQIAPIPEQNLSGAQGLGNSSPTYAISGGSNRARPGEPLPLLYGTHRMWPDVAAKAFTQYAGEEQYFNAAFNFGLGDVVIDQSTFKIGDTSIDEFEDVEIYLSGADGSLHNFPGNVDTISGSELTKAAGWISRTGSADTVALEIDIAGQLFYISSSGKLTSRTITLDVQYRRLDGPAGDPLASWQDIDIDVTYTYYWSLGYYRGSTWKQRRYSPEEYDNFTEGQATGVVYQDRDTFNPLNMAYYAEVCHWRSYAEIEAVPQSNRDPAPPKTRRANSLTISNDNRRPVRRTYRIGRLPAGQYEVRVMRVTPDETDDKAISDFTWTALRSFQVDDADYSNQTRMGLRIKASAQLNGQVDKINATVSRRLWVYSGAAWSREITNNPAWVFYDFALGGYDSNGKLIYGAGKTAAQMDLDVISAWADYCTTNSLTFNGIIDRALPAGVVLDAIAACGRATKSMATGKLGVVWEDASAAAVAVFGMGNIKAGTFSIDYISEQLAEAVEVTFINKDEDYKSDVVLCNAPGVTTPTRIAKVDYFGCTDKDMAGRTGNLLAAKNVYNRRRISFETDAEGFAIQKGEIAMLSHDLTQWGYSGRLVAGTTTALTLSKPVPFTSGEDHYITIRQPNGTMSTHLVDYQAGESDTITIATDPLASAPDDDKPVDWMWLFEPYATPGKRIKIVDVKPVDENSIRLIATDDEPGYYSAETDPYTYVAPTTKTYLTPKITALTITESLLDLSGLSRVHVSFTTTGSVDFISVRVKYNGGEWKSLGQIAENFIDIDLRQGVLLTVWAKPISRISTSAATSAQQDYTVAGVDGAMVDVANFSVSASGGFALATWDLHTHTAVRNGGYIRIRHTSKLTGADWSDGIDIGPSIPGSTTSAILPLLTGTYMAKAVDSLGNYSPNAALAATTVPTVFNFNAVEIIDEVANGFLGTHTNTVYINGALRLTGATLIDDMVTSIDDWTYIDVLGGIVSSGEYEFETPLDLGAVYSSRITADITAAGYDANDFISQRGYVSTWPSVSGSSIDDVAAQLYVSTTEDDPAGTPTWSDWKPFSIGDYLARALKFKIVLTSQSTNHNIAISELTVNVDMPDRVDGEKGVTVPSGGLSLTYTTPFRVAPALGVTIIDTQAGDIINISSETEEGATVQILNTGAGVQRTINWLAKGYGQKV